jgi:hypothetical protein
VGKFLSDALGHALDRVLRGTVGAESRGTSDSSERGDVDDTTYISKHMRTEVLRNI